MLIAMEIVFRPRLLLSSIAICCLLVGCEPAPPPFAQLSGVMFDGELDEISGLAASHRDADVLWLIDDGGNPARLFAIDKRGRRLATFPVQGVVKTDWEDIAAFDRDGKHYLLIADTGDNGGLRRSLQLHVFEEPSLDDHNRTQTTLKPAWSIAFRWPDGARDCEAVTVDAKNAQVLLISKKRQPPELFGLPLQPQGRGLQVARFLGTLAGVPRASEEEQRADPERVRLRNQVTAADISPDTRTLAVLTYHDLLLYPRRVGESWSEALMRPAQVHAVPLLPQPEALGWSQDGRGLFVTGEFSPAPLLFLNPPK
ncbi:MAG: hypothetical protein ABJA62_00475 [Luteimonas sp.]